MKKYAQIDENNICFATANLSDDTIVPDNWILIENETVLGKLYNNGKWEDIIIPDPEPIEPQPSNAELLEAINKDQKELQEQAVDAYTKELLEGGII